MLLLIIPPNLRPVPSELLNSYNQEGKNESSRVCRYPSAIGLPPRLSTTVRLSARKECPERVSRQLPSNQQDGGSSAAALQSACGAYVRRAGWRGPLVLGVCDSQRDGARGSGALCCSRKLWGDSPSDAGFFAAFTLSEMRGSFASLRMTRAVDSRPPLSRRACLRGNDETGGLAGGAGNCGDSSRSLPGAKCGDPSLRSG